MTKANVPSTQFKTQHVSNNKNTYRSASTKDDSRLKEEDEKCLSRADFHVSADASLLSSSRYETSAAASVDFSFVSVLSFLGCCWVVSAFSLPEARSLLGLKNDVIMVVWNQDIMNYLLKKSAILQSSIEIMIDDAQQ